MTILLRKTLKPKNVSNPAGAPSPISQPLSGILTGYRVSFAVYPVFHQQLLQIYTGENILILNLVQIKILVTSANIAKRDTVVYTKLQILSAELYPAKLLDPTEKESFCSDNEEEQVVQAVDYRGAMRQWALQANVPAMHVQSLKA